MKYVIFALQSKKFGIDIHLIHEFSKAPYISAVLGQSSKVAGLVNLRGRITLALDLGCCFDLAPEIKGTKPKTMIVLDSQDNLSDEAKALGVVSHTEPLILLIDRIISIVEVEATDFHPVPSQKENDLIDGLIQVDNELIPLLSIPQLINTLA